MRNLELEENFQKLIKSIINKSPNVQNEVFQLKKLFTYALNLKQKELLKVYKKYEKSQQKLQTLSIFKRSGSFYRSPQLELLSPRKITFPQKNTSQMKQSNNSSHNLIDFFRSIFIQLKSIKLIFQEVLKAQPTSQNHIHITKFINLYDTFKQFYGSLKFNFMQYFKSNFENQKSNHNYKTDTNEKIFQKLKQGFKTKNKYIQNLPSCVERDSIEKGKKIEAKKQIPFMKMSQKNISKANDLNQKRFLSPKIFKNICLQQNFNRLSSQWQHFDRLSSQQQKRISDEQQQGISCKEYSVAKYKQMIYHLIAQRDQYKKDREELKKQKKQKAQLLKKLKMNDQSCRKLQQKVNQLYQYFDYSNINKYSQNFLTLQKLSYQNLKHQQNNQKTEKLFTNLSNQQITYNFVDITQQQIQDTNRNIKKKELNNSCTTFKPKLENDDKNLKEKEEKSQIQINSKTKLQPRHQQTFSTLVKSKTASDLNFHNKQKNHLSVSKAPKIIQTQKQLASKALRTIQTERKHQLNQAQECNKNKTLNQDNQLFRLNDKISKEKQNSSELMLLILTQSLSLEKFIEATNKLR